MHRLLCGVYPCGMEADMVNCDLSKAGVVREGIVAKGRDLNLGLSPADRTLQHGVLPIAAGQGVDSVVPAAQRTGDSEEASSPPELGLGPDLQAVIGQRLRVLHHKILNEPIPDRFVRLLDELAKKEGSGS